MDTGYNGESSGTTNQVEDILFNPQLARYVKLIGFGNSVNLWNSLTEFVVNRPDPEVALITRVRFSTCCQASLHELYRYYPLL